MTEQFLHIPVLLLETVHGVLPNEQLIEFLTSKNETQINIVDATIGGAGHATCLIEEFHKNPLYKNFFLNFIGIDQDTTAISIAEERLSALKTLYPRFHYTLVHANFDQLKSICDTQIHGLYADFGVSSPQLDTRERGFSFLHEGPLDMRMDRTNTLTAAHILNTYSEADLAQIFFEYGEEPKSRRLARAIVEDRKHSKLPLENTKIFADYVKRVLKYPHSRTHPATRIFQALRIEVNGELHAIQTLLATLPDILSPSAKACFISFHSLEDRLVKKTMRSWQMKGLGRENPRGGIVPNVDELARNPRSRSARLRVFECVRT